jgi:hypothetical protein
MSKSKCQTVDALRAVIDWALGSRAGELNIVGCVLRTKSIPPFSPAPMTLLPHPLSFVVHEMHKIR